MARILVVDDEIEVCDFLRDFLQQEGYEVVTITNGEEALALLDKEKPDLTLLDIRLSGISGMDVLRRARAMDENLQVMMITALDDDVLMHYAMELGAIDYIIKPFTTEYLTKILSAKISEIFGNKDQSEK